MMSHQRVDLFCTYFTKYVDFSGRADVYNETKHPSRCSPSWLTLQEEQKLHHNVSRTL